MRGALIHGVLLAVMLVYGYRTWTRDTTVKPNVGDVVLWDKSENDLVSIEYRSPKKIVKLERKPEGYWWGVDTTIETKAKPPKPTNAAGSNAGSAGSAAGSGSAGSGSAGSGAGSGSAAAPEPPTIEEEETGRKVREFPLGESADKLVKSYAAARALRDLGKPNDAAKKDYKLGTKPLNIVTMKDGKDVSTSTITVNFKDGSRTFVVGGAVYGGSDKYVIDQASGKAYVLSKDLLSALEVGESSLHLTDPRGFDATKIGSVTLEANGRSKSFARITTQGGADQAQQVKTWGDPATKKADQTAANFIDNANNLRPTEYAATLKVSDLTPVMKLTYKDERGALLGTLSLYKREKPGQLMEGQELDPANPPKGDTEYYIITEKTRVPAIVRKDTAQRSEQDIETVLSGKQAEPKSVDPKGNPFGNMPPGHGALPGAPGGAPTAPGTMPGAPGAAPPPNPHGAPPAGAGSAVKPGVGVTPPGTGAGSGAAPKPPKPPVSTEPAAKPPAPKAPTAPEKAPAPAKPAAPTAPQQ
ncbi:MAG TPA: DUF4340 domain-containing protein [Kofleriaceae bacterium]